MIVDVQLIDQSQVINVDRDLRVMHLPQGFDYFRFYRVHLRAETIQFPAAKLQKKGTAGSSRQSLTRAVKVLNP
jgi:hypothetical protein